MSLTDLLRTVSFQYELKPVVIISLMTFRDVQYGPSAEEDHGVYQIIEFLDFLLIGELEAVC